EAEYCLPVFVTEGSVSECEGTFLKRLGDPDIEEFTQVIIPNGNGNLLLGGRRGDQSLLMEVNSEGDIIWDRTFDMTAGDDFIQRLLFDTEGMLIVEGRDIFNNSTENFIFRYDINNDQILWVKKFLDPAYTRFESMLLNPQNDNIIFTGTLLNPGNGLDFLLMEVDYLTGDINWIRSWDSGGTLGVSYSGQIYNNELYLATILRFGGLNKIRPSITKTDLSGNIQWSRIYFKDEDGSSRQYNYEIHIQNDTIVCFGHGDRFGSNPSNYTQQLFKTDIDGNLLFAKDYNFGPNSTASYSRKIIPLPDGYILVGSHTYFGQSNMSIIRVDQQGNLIWAKNLELGDIDFTDNVLFYNGFIYFGGIGFDNDPSGDIVLGSMDLDGNISGPACNLISDLEPGVLDIPEDYDGNPDLEEVSITPNYQDGTGNSAPAGLATGFIDGCECETTIECDTTFLKSYGTEIDDEYSHAIAVVPDVLGGGYLLGGGKADSAMITWVDQVGDIIWTRSFDATFDAADFIWDLHFDSDNNVIGVGQTRDEPLDNVECLVFKYDMVNDNIFWINELDLGDPASESYYSVQEISPGGNYIVSGSIDQLQGGTGCDGVIVQLDRNTGTNVWQQNYTLGSCETFRRIIVHNNSIYTTGRYNFDGGGTDRMRPGVTQFDLNGNQVWSKLYLEAVTFNDNARLYSNDIIQDNGLVVAGFGDEDGSQTADVQLFLFKTDLGGNLLWARRYDLPGSNTERVSRLMNVPDGYLILGTHISGDKDAFVIKTDKDGIIQWSKSFGTDEDDEAWDMVFNNSQVYFTGKTTGLGAGTSEDMYLINLNVDGTSNAQDSCNLFEDIVLTDDAWVDPYEGSHPLTNLNQTWGFFLDNAIMGETSVQSTIACFNPCVDSCDLVPEANVISSTAACSGVQIEVTLEVCNDGNFPLPAGTPVTIYNGDPTATNANIVASLLSPEGIGYNECKDLTFLLNSLVVNTPYWIVINDDGTTPTPFDLNDFDAAEAECDYTNNIGSFQVDYQEIPLDLGPDQFICEFGVSELDAGAGYASYLWNDGSNMQTLTAFFPGTYWVEVTDECGFTQTDAITIEVDPASILDLGLDQELCQGESFSFDLSGFDSWEWIPADYLDCDDCPNPTVSPEADITYIVSASTDDGCISVDTINFVVLDTLATEESLEICDGQSVIIFGQEVSDAGVYTEIFTAQNGCDSTHTVTLTVLENIETFEQLLICFGDSVEIFGEFISSPGDYEMTFEAQNGCDSTHLVDLHVTPEILIDFEVTDATCFDGTDGSITTTASAGQASLSFEWEDGSTDPDRTDLAAGTYSLTVTDENDCSASANVEVNQPDEILLVLQATDVSCDALGSAEVSADGGTGNITFEWNTTETGPQITDLEAGTYVVTATDENGCTATASVDIEGALVQTVSIDVLQELTIADPEGGELMVNIDGGTGPFDIVWSNGESTNVIDSLPSGEYIVTVTDANGCVATDTAYLFLEACVGGEVWEDINRNGCDDGGEHGVSGVEMILSGTDIWGNPVSDTVLTIFNGSYVFEDLPPGDYTITIGMPDEYLLSPMDACSNDFSDSDFNAAFESPLLSLEEGDCTLITDAGIYDECINVTDPGEICCDQVLCGPGNDPDPIQSISPATGASPVEYLWMFSYVGGGADNGSWIAIPGTNSPTYDPGPLYLTTHFVRCVRAVGCDTWLEGDYVTIEVSYDNAAQIIVPEGAICTNVGVVFSAVPVTGATYSWQFGGSANPPTANTADVYVSWSEAAYPSVSLTVTTDACTSTETVQIAVSDDPNYCSSSMQSIDPETTEWRNDQAQTAGNYTIYPNPTKGYLALEWKSVSSPLIRVDLHSIDGKRIQSEIADGLSGQYETDLSQLPAGMYLIRITDAQGESIVFRVVKE
ncbi:MAG: T9SS type A sorting domain-containing protein, partial [Bacteroidetes bacterium]|nr:T9SS type A sorting domain-containing protein [Bacteroidota bacterium]